MRISIKRILAGMLLVTGVAQAGTPVEKAYSAENLNILLIISDDQGYGDFGFMGNTVLRTPQLDKLAASAAIFENYTTGVACSPGRAMLFTGRNHLSTGVWGVGARYGLRRDETLMPMFFRKNGYSTFYLGKGDCVAPHRMSPHYAGWQESLFVGGYQHHNGRLYHSPLAPLHSIKPVDVEGWTSEFMTQRGIRVYEGEKGIALAPDDGVHHSSHALETGGRALRAVLSRQGVFGKYCRLFQSYRTDGYLRGAASGCAQGNRPG